MPRILPLLSAAALILLTALTVPARAGNVLGDDFNEDEDHDYNGMPKLRLSLETGYSQWMYNPDSLSPEYDKYLNTLESGWNYAAEAAWFPWSKGGIGVTWIWFLSKASDGSVVINESDGIHHSLRERASFVYYGPTFLSRLQFGRFGLIVGGFGAGFLNIRDAWTDNAKQNVVTAKTYALTANVGWDYSFYRLVSLGINARVLLSDIAEYSFNGEKVKLHQPDDPHYWNSITLTRFELNGGIRFGL
jgi:hypothetical protein